MINVGQNDKSSIILKDTVPCGDTFPDQLKTFFNLEHEDQAQLTANTIKLTLIP